MHYIGQSYETDQLLSVVGSKRPIQDHLERLFIQLVKNPRDALFLDPFSGSGAVSRVARKSGFNVVSSDIEPFTFIPNFVYLALEADDLATMFQEYGGIDAYITMLNLQGLYAASSNILPDEGYISMHYAPRDDESYDGTRERLFYTRSNALFIDAVREEIERNWITGKITAAEKCVVTASLLYEASRRANTSGTFTSYHKKFGSFEKSALSRITNMCELRAPVLPDWPTQRASVRLCPAEDAVSGRSADICYLDPPSTVHQYGSTYHLLNSIAMWDKIPVDNEKDSDERLLNRAGIRSDARSTYSEFCSLKYAFSALHRLINRIDTRVAVLTYPQSGVLQTEEVLDILHQRFKQVRTIAVSKRNQGGRQPHRKAKSLIEHIFIAGKGPVIQAIVETDIGLIDMIARLRALDDAVFSSMQPLGPFEFIGAAILKRSWHDLDIRKFDPADLEIWIHCMEQAVLNDLQPALEQLLHVLTHTDQFQVDGKEKVIIEKRILSLLRKSADPEDSETFEHLRCMIERSCEGNSTLLSQTQSISEAFASRLQFGLRML